MRFLPLVHFCMGVVIGAWFAVVIAAIPTPLHAAPVCAEGGCGLPPLPPLPPLGCADLIARCQCDENADNCRWVWECIPAP